MTVIESYVPLYRKYRPQKLEELVGQEVVKTALANAIKLNKIAHAYLFCGPRGTGKTSTARIIAKSLNCEHGPTLDPCQACGSCLSIMRGSALDVTEIDAASNNGVDDIREITEKVQFSAMEGKFKIFIIDEVHMLSTQAFNALLKTLEEPPPNVIFIFATTEPHKVLPTILSRCQRFDLSRISRDQIEARLREVAQAEGINILPEAVSMIARHVRGGMRDALGLLDQVAVLGLAESGRQIGTDDIRSFIGNLEEDVLFQLSQSFAERTPELLLTQLQQLEEKGVDPPQVVKNLTLHLRNLLIAKTCTAKASADSFDLSPESYERYCQQAALFTPEELPQMLYRLSVLENQLKHSTSSQMWLEVGMLELCYRESIHLVQELSERVRVLEDALAKGGPVPANRAASAPPRPVAPARPAMQPAPVQQTAPVQPIHQVAPVQVPPPPTQAPVQVSQPESQPVAEQPAVAETPQDSGQGSLGLDMPAAPHYGSEGGNLEDIWHQILGQIPSVPTQALISQQGNLVKMTEAQLTIAFSNDAIYRTFTGNQSKVGHLQQAVQIALGRPMKVEYIVDGSHFANKRKEAAAAQALMAPPPPQQVMGPPPAVYVEPIQAPPADPSSEALPEQAMGPAQPAMPPNPIAQTVDYSEMAQAKDLTRQLFQGKMID